ncbi:hypothetical protein GCM10027091_40890 [Streptomyces daliensis]
MNMTTHPKARSAPAGHAGRAPSPHPTGSVNERVRRCVHSVGTPDTSPHMEVVMQELPGIGLLILTLLSDEVLTVPQWRLELAAGDND